MKLIIIFVFTFIIHLASSELTVCSTDDTPCTCTVGLSSTQLSCDRLSLLTRVPTLTDKVTELDMFRTSPTQPRVSSDSLRLATALTIIRIESCDIRIVEAQAFQGLYSLQTLNLAYNNIIALHKQTFVDQTVLQTLDLSFNSLESLSIDVFEGLSNLKYLDLSYNSLQSISADVLRPLTSLKTLKLENTLLGLTILPDQFLTGNPNLEALNLNDNKITHIQPELFETTTLLRELTLKGNKIATINGDVFEGLQQLMTLDIGENPFVCDCQLLSYKLWLDAKTSKNWHPDETGRCTTPSDIHRQPILTLPVSKFTCATTTSTNAQTADVTIPGDVTGSSSTNTSTGMNNSTDNGNTGGDKSAAQSEDDIEAEKAAERSIIIGCSVGGAFLFIIINILIICCVRIRSKRHTGTLKTKYIIRPDELEDPKEEEDNSNTPYKQPKVDGVGNGYVISNGVSGFYHTGSRTKLYNCDYDNNCFGTPPDVPPKLNSLLDEGMKARPHTSSVFSIPVSPTTRYTEYQSYNTDGSFYAHNGSYANTWDTPTHGTWPHRVRFKASRHENIDTAVYRAEVTDHAPSKQTDQGLHVNPAYTSTNSDYHINMENGSQEFLPGDTQDMKYSTGSGDSGVHSTSPCPAIEDNMSPTLSHRHLDHNLISIHELDQSHISIGSKKIRNETYV